MEQKRIYKPYFDVNEYIGKRNNHLTVIGLAERKPNDDSWRLHCRCDCGGTIDVLPYQFKNGAVKSCGCIRNTIYNKQDGRSKHPLYGIWRQMMQRCYNEKSKIYHRYGGRGIYVCEEWHNFFKFVEWSNSVGGRPDGYTLDRKDNDGPYSPENCRWATMHDQCRNKSDNVIIEYNGKSQALVDWADEIGINKAALQHRYNRGWSIERMMTEPLHEKPNHKAGA